ncbi:MAG: hypothetical protein GX683_02215, partial [Ruminococcaceae bacterium]|nr:hypothetical protein [Oscillospiraceae bacterium]
MEVAVNLAAEGVSMRRGEQSAATGTRQNTGDIFLMLIQNLIDGTDVQITEGMTELLTSQGDTEEDDNLLAGFAGMLLQNPEILPVDILNLVSGNETQASDILESVASGTENPNAAVAAAKLMSMFRDENGQLILPETIDAVETQKPNVEQTAQPTAKTTDAEAMLQIPVTQASYSEQGANASDLMGERQFRNAVSEVKEGLAAGPAKDEHEETTEALDVDSIGASKPQNIFEYGLKTV